jgi:hypothetical protein
VSNTATVTVTVTPVNDAPAAFDDAFAFDKPSGPPLPPGTVTYGYGAVLGNDIDYDGPSGLTVAAVDPSGLTGTVDMSADGTFSWSGPREWSGQTSFKYKVQDYGGAESNWATVHLFRWATDGPHDAAPEAEPDVVAVGDDPRTFAVTDNDANWSVAVLVSHPAVGRLTAFDATGTATYAPGIWDVDASFSYKVFSARGEFVTEPATVQVVVPNLQIAHGQYGGLMRDPNELRDVGAFTVVNTNDSDGKDGYDHTQETPVKDGGPSKDQHEKDLMRLRVNKPTGFGAKDEVTVSVSKGPARFFGTEYRENPLGKEMTLKAESFTQGGGSFQEYWVEIYEPSNTVRSVEIQMKYGAATDTVAATGIWAGFDTPGGFHITGNTPGQWADNKDYRNIFVNLAKRSNGTFKLGMPDPFLYPTPGKAGWYIIEFGNAAEFDFTTSPAGVERELGGRIKFDLSRSAEDAAYRLFPGKQQYELVADSYHPWPPFREQSNDDNHKEDEDNEPWNNHIYSFDFPGFTLDLPAAPGGGPPANLNPWGWVRVAHRMNAQEFVRVLIDRGDFKHPLSPPAVQGSRASEFVSWRAWVDFTWDGKAWGRTPDGAGGVKYNEITLYSANQPRYLGDPGG